MACIKCYKHIYLGPRFWCYSQNSNAFEIASENKRMVCNLIDDYCLNEKAKEYQKVFQTLPDLPNDLKKHILTFYKFKAPIKKCALCNNFMYKTYGLKELKKN